MKDKEIKIGDYVRHEAYEGVGLVLAVSGPFYTVRWLALDVETRQHVSGPVTVLSAVDALASLLG